MIKISASIITFNEAHNIERCITSLLPVADEIFVVDSYSTDNTKEICLRLGARFIENPFQGHIQQKNFALEHSTNQWVLSLDADEALTPELQQSILEVKNNPLFGSYVVVTHDDNVKSYYYGLSEIKVEVGSRLIEKLNC